MKDREERLKNLFLRSQQNDQIAYAELLQELSQLLKAYLSKLMSPKMRSKERIEDLVQEILLGFHRKRDLYSVDRPFLPWIYAIAKYRFIDSIRSQAKDPELVEWMEHLDTREYIYEPELFGQTGQRGLVKLGGDQVQQQRPGGRRVIQFDDQFDRPH